MKTTLLYLSKRKKIQTVSMKYGFTRKIAKRFIAGETLEDAIEAVKGLNQKGMIATIDHLGEAVTQKEQAIEAANAYQNILDEINKSKVNSNVSLKLTQMGLDIDYNLCYDNVKKIVEKAKEYNNYVRIDMEDSNHTQKTIDVLKALRKDYDNVGIVLQAYLYRSFVDAKGLLYLKTGVRLCKGAYKEPESEAFQNKKAVDENFVRMMELLLTSGVYHGIATQDEKMIDKTNDFAEKNNISKKSFEFQMLYGIRRDLQEQLVKEGYTVRIYTPYGTDWYPYFMRRLAERPANLFFLVKSIIKDV